MQIMRADRSRAQLEKAPAECPDYILFDGGTNDAEYILNNPDVQYGEVTDSKDPASFDTATFAALSRALYISCRRNIQMHSLSTRRYISWEAVTTMCRKSCGLLNLQHVKNTAVAVADVYGGTDLDTNDVNKKNDYTFDSLAANGLPGNNGSGTHPNFKAIEEFYVPLVTATLRDPASSIPDTEEPVDKQDLEAKLSEASAEAEKTDIYTAESLATLNEAIEAAQAVFDDPTAEQDQVNAQITALEDAMKGLVSQIDVEKRKSCKIDCSGGRSTESDRHLYRGES